MGPIDFHNIFFSCNGSKWGKLKVLWKLEGEVMMTDFFIFGWSVSSSVFKFHFHSLP